MRNLFPRIVMTTPTIRLITTDVVKILEASSVFPRPMNIAASVAPPTLIRTVMALSSCISGEVKLIAEREFGPRRFPTMTPSITTPRDRAIEASTVATRYVRNALLTR